VDAIRPYLHELTCWLGRFERRVLQTALARIQTAKRLERRGYAWTAALVGLVLITLLGSVLDLAFTSRTPILDQVVLIGFAVVALAGSLVVANREYGVRSTRMASNYRQMQALSAEVEVHRTRKAKPDIKKATDWMMRYDSLLEAAENHTAADHRAARRANSYEQAPRTCNSARADKRFVCSKSTQGRELGWFTAALSLFTSSLHWLVLVGSYAFASYYLISLAQG
jgi:hypothetical protein